MPVVARMTGSTEFQFCWVLASRVSAIRTEIAAAAGQIEMLETRLSALRASLGDAMAAAGVPAVPMTATPSGVEATARAVKKGAFQDQVLAVMTLAYPKGLTSPEIARSAQARLGLPVHPKTTGMVLNRLKRAGRVERSGRMCRLLPPEHV